jgi:hypothetical protein
MQWDGGKLFFKEFPLEWEEEYKNSSKIKHVNGHFRFPHYWGN